MKVDKLAILLFLSFSIILNISAMKRKGNFENEQELHRVKYSENDNKNYFQGLPSGVKTIIAHFVGSPVKNLKDLQEAIKNLNSSKVNLESQSIIEDPVFRKNLLASMDETVKKKLNLMLILNSYIGNVDKVKFLLQLGADPDYIYRYYDANSLDDELNKLYTELNKFKNVFGKPKLAGSNALIAAVLKENKEIVKLLLEADAKPNIQDNVGDTALMDAAELGYEEVVRILLEAGAKPNIQDNLGMTALMDAADRGKRKIVKLLLEAGAKPDIQDNLGMTALMGAAHYGYEEIVRILLEAGAKPDIQGNRGMTALMDAADRGKREIVKLLLEAGAKPDIQDIDGATALMGAAHYGYEEIVRILLEAGASLNIQNNDGDTALDVTDQENIITMLQPILITL